MKLDELGVVFERAFEPGANGDHISLNQQLVLGALFFRRAFESRTTSEIG